MSTLARAQIPLEWLQPPSEGDAEIATDEELFDDLFECLYNTKLSTHFRDFGKELGVADAKSLEDIYRSHLENTRKFPLCSIIFLCLPFPIQDCISANVNSARGNLAATFVNAFVNAGFGNDKLMVTAEEGSSWISLLQKRSLKRRKRMQRKNPPDATFPLSLWLLSPSLQWAKILAQRCPSDNSTTL